MRRLTLGHVFGLALVGLGLLLGGFVWLLDAGSRRSIVESSNELREAWSGRIAAQVQSYLYDALRSLERVEQEIRFGARRPDDPLSLEASLFAEVLNNPNLAEVTLTHGEAEGHDDQGELLLGPRGRWQISVFREAARRDSPVSTRTVREEASGFAAEVRHRNPGGGLLDARFVREATAPVDPTADATFEVPARVDLYGKPVWTDLSWSPMDAGRPEADRRVVVTVMKAVEDGGRRFVGVLRAGLRTEQLDEVVRLRLGSGAAALEDLHRRFLCDAEGRLITRLSTADRLVDQGALRVQAATLPPEIGRALEDPMLRRPTGAPLHGSTEVTASGRRYLVTFRGLEDREGRIPEGGISDWRIGIVVPEDAYLGSLREARARLLVIALAVMALILGGGTLTLGAIRRGLSQIESEAGRMRRFEFAPAAAESPFRDVREVRESLELAKTALRAMGRYVPVALVRQLYETGREPALGGELREVSMLFSDIAGFTTIAEDLTPDRLARALGLYLEAMTAAIHGTGGIVDKYIGDAVMALWNAPRPSDDHAARACAAALACRDATRALFASPAWAGLPPFATRFGLHRDVVMVGHFGAPDRMSYTALGDGVNLASRLEGLNKQYGTSLLASETVYEHARAAFDFRRLDVVAVKGKAKGTWVYELLGPRNGGPARDQARRYERALDAYLERRFADALALLETNAADPPSAVLAERCRLFLGAPPPTDWDGVHVSMTK
jgi:adenylate cyclase